jgi:hypothetical protein
LRHARSSMAEDGCDKFRAIKGGSFLAVPSRTLLL